VYLKQYFELFSIFDDIDTGSNSLCLRLNGMESFVIQFPVTYCNEYRDDKRVDLPEFKKALPLLVRRAKLGATFLDSDCTLCRRQNGEY
jgi:hypothetical protein